jgi:HAD superfamily hydrolase (TIGR01509 family)
MSEQKAFVFDMDGVMINSDNHWLKRAPVFYRSFFGDKIGQFITNKTFGKNLDAIFKMAVKQGFKGKKEDFIKGMDKLAKGIYTKAEITSGLEAVIDKLKNKNYKIGLVSASPHGWIKKTLKRISNSNKIDSVLSLDRHGELRHKPEPDGYLYIMKQLKVYPQNTFILEDSNIGIKAAKASGAKVICLKEYLSKNYKSVGADIYVNNLQELNYFI